LGGGVEHPKPPPWYATAGHDRTVKRNLSYTSKNLINIIFWHGTECCYNVIHNTTIVGLVLQIITSPRLMQLQELSNGGSQETKESPNKPHMAHGSAAEQPCFSICHWKMVHDRL